MGRKSVGIGGEVVTNTRRTLQDYNIKINVSKQYSWLQESIDVTRKY